MNILSDDLREMIADKYKWKLFIRTVRLVNGTKYPTPNNERLLKIIAMIEKAEDVSEVDAAMLARELFALDNIGVLKDG